MKREEVLGRKAHGGEGKAKAEKIIGVLFMSRTAAHLAHLKTPGYSKHMALNEFYSEIVELADSFAEVAQGKWGKLDFPFDRMVGNIDKPADMLEEHMEMIKSIGEGCGVGALNNIIDEIEALYLGTIYKIRELS
jgi:hypothetical protein